MIKKIKMSEGYAFIAVPLHISNELIKINRLFWKKKLMEEATSEVNFNVSKQHHYSFSNRPQQRVNNHPEKNVASEEKTLVPGSRFYTKVWTSSSSSTSNQNKRIAV